MSLIGSSVELSSYKRFVSLKYRDFLSENVPYIVQGSLAKDLEILCADSTTAESIRQIAGHLRNTEFTKGELVHKVIMSIYECTNIYSLYQLLFLINPILAEEIPE